MPYLSENHLILMKFSIRQHTFNLALCSLQKNENFLTFDIANGRKSQADCPISVSQILHEESESDVYLKTAMVIDTAVKTTHILTPRVN